MIFSLDLPDTPLIRNMMATGYPDGMDPQFPHCPICGEACETVYRDERGEIFGCDVCIRESDAWDVPECFPEMRASRREGVSW